MKIFITTTNSENSFVFKKDNEPEQTLPKIYKLEKVISQYRQNINDDSAGFTILAENVFNQEKLFKNVKLQDISINGEYFETYSSLSQSLTPILFKLGGSPGAGGAMKIENYNEEKVYQENDVVFFSNWDDINGIARSKFNDNNTYPFKLNFDEFSFRKIQAISKYHTHGKYYLTLDPSEVITNGENIFVTLNPNEFGILIKNAQDINTFAIPLFEEEENYTLVDKYSNSNRFDNDISDLYFNENMDIFYKQKWELIAQINEPNDYSIYEQQVGKFIYPKELPNGFDLVSKPKYRITVYSSLGTREIDDTTLSGADNISIPYIEQILSIQANYNVDNKQIGFGESNFFKNYAAQHRTINERINIGYYLENSEIIIYGYMKTIDPENILPDTEFALADRIKGIITLEYTKTSDQETFIKEFGRL